MYNYHQYLQWPSLLIGVAVLVALQCSYNLIYNLFLSPLKAYPGPWYCHIFHFPEIYQGLSGTQVKWLDELHGRYGPVVRVAPNKLSYTNGNVWKDVYARRIGHLECVKANTARTANGVESILVAETENHSRFRRLLAHAFSLQGLRQYEHIINHHVQALMDGLRSHSTTNTGEALPMTSWFNWATFDLIGDLAFGSSFGCLQHTRTHRWVEFVLQNLKAFSFLNAIRLYHLTPLAPLLVPINILRGYRENYRYASDQIDKRLPYGRDRGDFFDHLLKHGDPEKVIDSESGKGMTTEELKSNASALVLAGSETSATMLSGMIFLLLGNPAVHEKAMREVRTAFAAENEITIASTAPLQYLEAIIEETMRLYPPAPAPLARVIPECGATVDGAWLPGGTVVRIAHQIAYRSESNFARPTEFIPERWLPNADHEFEGDNPNGVYQPFSFGPRNCLGRHLAYAEMRLIAAKLLFSFDFAVPSDAQLAHLGLTGGRVEWDRWMSSQKVFIIWEKLPLYVNVFPRGQKHAT